MLHWNGRGLRAVAFALAGSIGLAQSSFAEDRVLSEAVEFSGQILYLQTDVPGLVMGAVRNGETAVFGFGETAKGSGKTPDGDTLMRVGSVTKVFTGAVLANPSSAVLVFGKVPWKQFASHLPVGCLLSPQTYLLIIDLQLHTTPYGVTSSLQIKLLNLDSPYSSQHI